MEDINIKDYLQINTAPKNVLNKAPIKYNFSLIFDNGSDFIVERSTSRNIKRQLCFIADKNLLFIRDPKTNVDKAVTGERQIKDFFNEEFNHSLKFKNEFFNRTKFSEFCSVIYELHSEKPNIRRNFIKYGYNPSDYLNNRYYSSTLEALDDIDFNKTLKIVRIIQEYYDELHKKNEEEINQDFILFLIRIMDIFSIDYVKMFLEIYTAYDATLELHISAYERFHFTGVYKFAVFEKLLQDFNLDFKRFCTYLFRDLYSEGISNIDESILEEYYDCLNMQKEMYGKIKEKYPEHFKETHDKTVLVYNLNLQYFREKKVEQLTIHNKALEFSNKDYSIIVAKTSQDLINEGINLHHCVGSYVKKVQNGECSIFFLRKTDALDTSLITIEVVNDEVLQIRGLCERLMDSAERKFVNKWCETKKLKLIGE